MGDCCSNCGRKKFMVMLFCSFVLLLMQNVDVMAGELWSGAEVSIEGPIMIDHGQTVTCNMRVKNTSTVDRYMELYNWYYRESDNSETYPGTEFGTLLDSEGKKSNKNSTFFCR